MKRESLHYTQYLDNDHAYWRALGTEAWPTLYLVDRCGLIRGKGVGEVHEGDPSGQRWAKAIEALLAETPGRCGP
ncbi:MAG TPA: hypothetical protein VN083_11195 [Vicinamibacteria bacterium]|nr:hypothetical protein [Vicinamibacteria bacterium]